MSAEIGDALEYGCGSQMTPRVQYAAIFVYALHIDTQLLKQYVNLLGDGEGAEFFGDGI